MIDKDGHQIDQFRYNKIHTWFHGGIPQKNVLFIAEPQEDFFCFIPPTEPRSQV